MAARFSIWIGRRAVDCSTNTLEAVGEKAAASMLRFSASPGAVYRSSILTIDNAIDSHPTCIL